jgi:hypothetical protein
MGETKDKSGIDRRDLIKRAASAGSAVWVAPVLLASLPSPAAASSADAGCYKYMFDWRWASAVFTCPNGQLGSPQNDAIPCAQNTGENHHSIGGVQQKIPGVNCCEDKAPAGPGGEGNVLQWYEHPDIPGGCVEVSSNQFCSSSTTEVVVTFTMRCPGCYITDGLVRYDSSGQLLAGNPNYCAVASVSENGFASSKLISQSVTITFTGAKVPVWFKFFVACGISADHPQGDGYFPDTDCQFFTTDSTTI